MSNNLKYYNNVKKFFINLKDKTDRLEDTRKQVGNDFTRIEAINGREIDFVELDQLFDMRKCNKAYCINQTRAQACATISQYKIFQQVLLDDSIKENDFVLICEDDNTYVSDFREKLNQLLEFIDQKRFNDCKMVVLKYLVLEQQVDYLPLFQFFNDQHIHLTDQDLENIKTNYPHFYNRAKFLQTKTEIFNVFRNDDRKNLSWSFEYKNVDFDQNQDMYDNTQSLFSTYTLRPFSASCFLIKKSLIRKIVHKYKKPWWFADDFKQFCDIQDILFASPFLAYDSETGLFSSIVGDKTKSYDLNKDEFILSNAHFNRVTRNRHIKLFKRLKFFKRLVIWQYSNNRILAFISRQLQKLVFIRRFR